MADTPYEYEIAETANIADDNSSTYNRNTDMFAWLNQTRTTDVVDVATTTWTLDNTNHDAKEDIWHATATGRPMDHCKAWQHMKDKGNTQGAEVDTEDFIC
jgi:hypothetical protein